MQALQRGCYWRLGQHKLYQARQQSCSSWVSVVTHFTCKEGIYIEVLKAQQHKVAFLILRVREIVENHKKLNYDCFGELKVNQREKYWELCCTNKVMGKTNKKIKNVWNDPFKFKTELSCIICSNFYLFWKRKLINQCIQDRWFCWTSFCKCRKDCLQCVVRTWFLT